VSVPETYIRDYFVQLCQDDEKHLQVHIRLDGPSCAGRNVTLSIPEAGFKKNITTDASGIASAVFKK
jgi:beta-glucuronidase